MKNGNRNMNKPKEGKVFLAKSRALFQNPNYYYYYYYRSQD